MLLKVKILPIILIAFSAAWLLSTPASAQSLNDLRTQGIVGERYDGLLVIRDSSASQQIKNTVERINAERRAIYEKRAKEDNVSVESVGKVYAKQIVQQAPDGTYFLGPNGNWTQK